MTDFLEGNQLDYQDQSLPNYDKMSACVSHSANCLCRLCGVTGLFCALKQRSDNCVYNAVERH